MTDGFKPFEPRDLGHFVDTDAKQPKADARALVMVAEHISRLEAVIKTEKKLNTALSRLCLSLLHPLKQYAAKDDIAMTRLALLEAQLKRVLS